MTRTTPPTTAASPFWARNRHADRRPFLMARNRIVEALRAWFAAAGFVEVEPAALQVSPGNEAHLHAFATELAAPGGARLPRYLHTSPEFAMKKLLAAGEEKIFAFARVFRNREAGALHAAEFTMLEWYRSGAPYAAVMADTAAIVAEAARAAGSGRLTFRGGDADPFAAPERITLAEAFTRFAGIDLFAVLGDRAGLARRAGAAGIRIAADDSWSDIFSRVLVEKIEPNLGRGRPTILYEYPAAEAALARPKRGDARVAERFELYACGVELANGFGELTDAGEQRRRFAEEMDEKMRVYEERYPVDEDFLAALAHMPEASGVALGLDRLVMLAAGAPSIDLVQWTPVDTGGGEWNVNDLSRIKPAEAAPHTLRSAGDLAAAGLADPGRLAALEDVAARYAVAITPAMTELIDAADPADPIARQFLPDEAELTVTPEERADPIGDDVHAVSPGLIHRYPDRVLLKLVSACAVYCRFCFRRETVGPNGAGTLSSAALAEMLAYIAARPEIWEVIVSGGDPLIASPRRLAALTRALAAIDHVKVIRFHTRVPVVAPERITPALIAGLKSEGKATWVAIHANHPRELTADARAAIGRLADAGIALVSQSVLLAGVNDDAETLGALMRAFVECRVKPYYLHHGDLAPGTSHFRLPIATGQALMRAMRGRFSGLCQPTYMLDIPGGHGKVPIGPGYVCDGRVEDPQGTLHTYPPAWP